MKILDFSTYKFRCSFLPTLMSTSRAKDSLLSETAKKEIKKLWIKEVYERETFDNINKYTQKGIACEPDSMDLVQKATKRVYFKNKNIYENDFIIGTPDIIDEKNKLIIDIKNNWNIFTFSDVDEAHALKSYYYQVLGYMWLTDSVQAEIIFTLCNTPEDMMNDELMRWSYKIPEIGTSDVVDAKYKKHFIFDDIPARLRIKSFLLEFNEHDTEMLKDRVVAARQYMKGLSL